MCDVRNFSSAEEHVGFQSFSREISSDDALCMKRTVLSKRIDVRILEQIAAWEYNWSSERMRPQVFYHKNKNQTLGIVV